MASGWSAFDALEPLLYYTRRFERACTAFETALGMKRWCL